MFIPFVAKRYLFSHKKHNTINLITWVSIVGVAVGTMALVVIMSVLNGFENLISASFSDFDPELKILPKEGLFVTTDSPEMEAVRKEAPYSVWCEVVEQDGLLQYDRQQTPARIKGVDDSYGNIANLDSITWGGSLDFSAMGEAPQGALGLGLADKLGVGAEMVDQVALYVPKRKAVNLARPDANFTKMSFVVGGFFYSQQQQNDENMALLPIGFVRNIYRIEENKATSVELRISPPGETSDEREISRAQKTIISLLGEDYQVLNRHEQQVDFYRISKIEKWSTFMILSFILLIATFTIVGSLAMIVIEKREDIVLFQSLGMTRRRVRSLFTATGFGIALVGNTIGLLTGVAVVLLQSSFGIIKIGQGFVTDVYPVELRLGDLAVVTAIVLAMGYTAALYTSHSQIKENHD